jgi:DNA-binding NarL/FixJ family response regulator
MRQDYVRAARLFGTASVLRSAIGVPLLQAFRQHLNQAILTTQEALGSRFEVHHSEGRAMGFEAALEYARSAPEPIKSEPVLERNVLTDLTPRELEVLRLLARGDTNKEIAGDLGMSPTTVHSHVRSIFSKLNVSTRTAATRLALEQGLI